MARSQQRESNSKSIDNDEISPTISSKYQKDDNDDSNNAKKKLIICREVSKGGTCKFGDNCRFSHEYSHVVAPPSVVGPTLNTSLHHNVDNVTATSFGTSNSTSVKETKRMHKMEKHALDDDDTRLKGNINDYLKKNKEQYLEPQVPQYQHDNKNITHDDNDNENNIQHPSRKRRESFHNQDGSKSVTEKKYNNYVYKGDNDDDSSIEFLFEGDNDSSQHEYMDSIEFKERMKKAKKLLAKVSGSDTTYIPNDKKYNGSVSKWEWPEDFEEESLDPDRVYDAIPRSIFEPGHGSLITFYVADGMEVETKSIKNVENLEKQLQGSLPIRFKRLKRY